MESLRHRSVTPGYGAPLWGRKVVLAMVMALLSTAAVAPTPAVAEETVIAALGDSLTQGYGLPVEDGLIPQLQRWLDNQGLDVRLINAGVSGDTTAGGQARLGWTLTPEVDGLIVTLGANDMLRGIPPETARDNLDAILKVAQDSGLTTLLIGFKAPGNFGPEYKAAFDTLYPDLAEKYAVPLIPSFFAPLRAADDGSEDNRAQLMQPDGLHPTAQGVALVVEHIGPFVAEMIPEAP